MEKEMLAIARLKSGEGKFEKFMGWMQSDEGMAVRKTIAHVEKTVPAIAPDKSYVMFKVSVHNEEEMKKFASGNNPVAKPILMNVSKLFKCMIYDDKHDTLIFRDDTHLTYEGANTLLSHFREFLRLKDLN